MSDWKRLFDAYKHLPQKTLAHIRISNHFKAWYPDLLQEAFIGLLLASRWYIQQDGYGATFRTVAIKFIRRRVKNAILEIRRGSVKATIIRGNDKEDTQQQETAMRMELVRDALALLDQMSDAERAYVIAYYVDEVTITSVAETEGITRRMVTDSIRCGINNMRASFGVDDDPEENLEDS